MLNGKSECVICNNYYDNWFFMFRNGSKLGYVCLSCYYRFFKLNNRFVMKLLDVFVTNDYYLRELNEELERKKELVRELQLNIKMVCVK